MSFFAKVNTSLHINNILNYAKILELKPVILKTLIPQTQFVRKKSNRKLTRKNAMEYYVARKNRSMPLHRKELTVDNKEFLQEVVQDRHREAIKSPLKDEPWERHPFTYKTRRTGVLAIKIGAVPQWKKDGTKIYTTMLQVIDNHVIRYTPPDVFSKDEVSTYLQKFGSVVVGALSTDPILFRKEYCKLFEESGLPPKRKLTRFLVTPDAAIQPGTPLLASHFKVGDYVDVHAKTIGHGFQGVMKRWGFKGGPATHGATKFHRRPGSIGFSRKGKVRKGKKMPGIMGNRWRHLRGLKIWRINTKYNVLYVSSPMTPGPTHCYVRVLDTVVQMKRREMVQDPPYNPTFYPDQDASGELPEDILHEDLFPLSDPSIMFENAKS